MSPVFVGRGSELAALVAALESAVAGEPAVVLVGGEAGVGKTRLVEEAVGLSGTLVLLGCSVVIYAMLLVTPVSPRVRGQVTVG